MKFRTKITLGFSLLTLFSVVSLGVFFIYTGKQALRENQFVSGLRMTACLAKNIATDIAHDDVFRVYESLNQFKKGWNPLDKPETTVLGLDDRIYATTLSPARDYLSEPATVVRSKYQGLMSRASAMDKIQIIPAANEFLTLVPITRNQVQLGTLITHFPLGSLQQRSAGLLRMVLGYSIGLLAALWLIGWLLGKRMVYPLVKLTSSMQQVGQGNLDVHCELPGRRDEFAALGHGFEEMIKGLREKEALKDEIVKSERLAAIGQVAAGLAHEINNPLGGMLNAIDTYNKHGDNPEVTQNTMDLLNRGLLQLRDTVQALLVNVRLEDRDLNDQDLSDIHTLVESQADRKQIRMCWECNIEKAAGVPSSQIRQVIMNFLLNALQATPEQGEIRVSCRTTDSELEIRVDDTGPGIPAETKAQLFEPFTGGEYGNGLGLWVNYRIVSGLGGRIVIQDLDPGTRFVATVPRNAHFTRPDRDAER